MIAFHPLSEIFPLLSEEEHERLTEDVRAHGLFEPITLYDGLILDGRNRYRACIAAGVQPRFGAYQGDDPLAYAISHNVRRRHLDASQRAMVAAGLANLKDGQRADQAAQIFVPVTQERAAELLEVGRRSVQHARIVLDKGAPELVAAVNRGAIAVAVAAELATEDPELQREAAVNPDIAPHLAKRQRRQEREIELAAKQTALPEKQYGVILADPPWRFEVYSRETGMNLAADNHFPSSELVTIKALDVPSIAADDCVLFLWATAPMVTQALEIVAAWGFQHKSNCVWVKSKPATGYWFRNQHEWLLVGVKGRPPAPSQGENWASVIMAPTREHSRKPDGAYEMIEAYFPRLSKIELFARSPREGWSRWGNEA